MNSYNYDKFSDRVNQQGPFGNLILLPGTIANVGGYIADPPIGGYVVQGELTVGGDFAARPSSAPQANIDTSYTMGIEYDSTLNAAVTFSNGGTLNLAAQVGDMQTQHAQNSQYQDANIRIETNSTRHITGGYHTSYVSGGTYEAATFHSTSGTLNVVSDLVGTIISNNDVLLTGRSDDKGEKVDNASGNTITGTTIRTKSLSLYNNFKADLSTNLKTVLRAYKDASANNNTVTVQTLWAETGDIQLSGNFGKRTGTPGSYAYEGTIEAVGDGISISADCRELAGIPRMLKWYDVGGSYWSSIVNNHTESYIEANYDAVYGDDKTTIIAYQEKPDAPDLTITTKAEWDQMTPSQKNVCDKWVDYTPAYEAKGASATGNKIGVYGLLAANGSITAEKDFGAQIKTTLQNTKTVVFAAGDNTGTLDVTLENFGLYANNIKLKDTFNGNITAETSNTTISATSPKPTTHTITIISAAMYAKNELAVDGWFTGDLTTRWLDTSLTVDKKNGYKTYLYGLHAGTKLVLGSGRGFMNTNITVSQSNTNTTDPYMAPARLVGIYAPAIEADSIGANITVTNSELTTIAVGIQADSFKNNMDSVFNVLPSTFDIIGDITVTGPGDNIGIMVNSQVQLRISSNITVQGGATYNYAVWAGSIRYADYSTEWSFSSAFIGGQNDTLELAAGSTVVGNIGLGTGTDTLVIDSNAKLQGSVTNWGGQLTLNFALNRYLSVNGTEDAKTTSATIGELLYNSEVKKSESAVIVDANDAESGQTYHLFTSADAYNGDLELTVLYNGMYETLRFSKTNDTTKFDEVTFGGITVKGEVLNGSNIVQVTVTKNEAIPVDEKVANIVNLKFSGNNALQYSFSNSYDQTKYDSSVYQLLISYDIYNDDGSFSRTVTATAECNSSNLALDADSSNIRNVHAAIVRKDDPAKRINTLSVLGSMDAEAKTFHLEWGLSLSESLNSNYRYELEYSIKKAGETEFSNSTLVTLDYLSASYDLVNIEENDEVRARIRVKKVSSTKEFNVGEWSEVVTLKNGAAEEKVAQVGSLVDKRIGTASNNLRILEWEDMRNYFSEGLQKYTIEFFDSKDALTEAEVNGIWASGGNSSHVVITREVTSNMFYLDGTYNMHYYWRVKAVSNNGTVGTWSDTAHTQPVGQDELAPVKSAKCDGTTINVKFDYVENSITWDWKNELAVDEGSGVATYVLYYKAASDSGYKYILLDRNDKQTYSTTLSGGLALNQQYSFYITARDEAGNESSTLKGITNIQGDSTAPNSAKLIWNTSDNANDYYKDNSAGGKDFSISLTIQPAEDPEVANEQDGPSGVKRYILQRRRGSSGGTEQWIDVGIYDKATVGSGLTIQTPGIDTRDIPADANKNCPTYWRLLVEDYAGNIQENAKLQANAVQPGKVLIDAASMKYTLVEGENQTFTVTFEWGEADSSPYLLAAYNLYVSEDGKTWKLMQTVDEVDQLNYSVKLSEKDGLLGGKTYYWAVEGVDDKGFSSIKQTPSVAGEKTFTTPEYVPPPETFTFKDERLSSVYENEMLNITISWSIGSGIPSGYELRRAVAGSGVYETFLTADASATSFNFTVSPEAQYDYVIVAKDYNYPDNKPVESIVLNTTRDMTKPVFTSSNTTLTDLTGNNYQLTWSGAVDPNGAVGEPVSGLKEYNLYFSTSSTLDPGKAICITVGGATNYTLTRDILLANGISEGTYNWWVGAKDWAGNEGYLQGQGSFFVKLTPPKGQFTNMDTDIAVSYEMVDDPTVSNGKPVRQPTSISVTFNMATTFTETVKYRIELASSADFASGYLLLSEEFTGSSFALSTANNGIAYIAKMAQGKKGYYSTYNDVPDIYWRVCAIDSYGNETAYSKTNVFKLADKDLDRSLNDYYAPAQVELYAPKEVEGSNGTLWNLDWSPVFDPFGIYTYEIALSNGVDAPLLFYTQPHINDTTVVVGGKELPVSAGTYTVTVTAIDGSGKRSPVSNSQTVHCGVPNPIYPGSGTSIMDPEGHTNASATPDRSYSATITSTIGTEGNVEHYYRYDGVEKNGRLNLSITGLSQKVKITLYADNQSGKWKKLKSFTVNAGGGTLLSDYLLASNLYYIKVEAMDKKKFNTQTSYVLNFDSTYFPDWTPNKGFGDQSEEIILTTTDSQKTGSISGFVGYLEAQDYYVINSDIAGSLNLSVSTNAKVKVTVYNADYRKITSASVKAGQYSNIFKKPALCPSGKVYIVVESGDKGKGKQNADYTIGVSDNLFQPATANNDTGSAQSVLLDVNGHGLFSGGWVGYGDKVDYYKFTSALNGAVELGITEVESKIKVTLYDTTGKKLKSKTIKGTPDAKYATADIFGKDVLLKAGQEYYISVESGDKGKGYQNSFYNLSINESYAPASRGNNVKENAMALTAGQTTSDWVGYNEPSDFYKITLDKESYLDLNFNFSGKVSLKMTSEYGGKSGNVSLIKTDSGYSSKSMLAAGEYFVEIRAKSPNNVNSWSNSYNLAYSTR